MGFDKDYPNRKDKRKQYRDSRRFDKTCKNNNACSYCRNNRLYQINKELQKTDLMLEELYKNLL